ncbi:MAG TPA: BON domain-containing protein [Oleiagrimonas sp.]|nr:BON domain-containing protein [Oleiagrimonas sp.]
MTNQSNSDVYREGQIWATYVVNPALQSYQIKSDVQGSKVTLSGTVDTKYDKLLAGTIAQQVKGISTVDNQIKVDPTHVVVTTFIPANVYAQHVQNATTSAEINSKLLWNEYTDGLDIRVSTHGGKVTLTGTADTAKAKQRAQQIAANTVGVHSVDNRITVNGTSAADSNSASQVSDDWIADKVKASYRYTSGMNDGAIDVDVNNGTVSLSGAVDSTMQRQRAIAIAQHIRGVDAVNADGIQVVSGDMTSD